jgi:uncharacterized protein YjbJ (UPF0337 family)
MPKRQVFRRLSPIDVVGSAVLDVLNPLQATPLVARKATHCDLRVQGTHRLGSRGFAVLPSFTRVWTAYYEAANGTTGQHVSKMIQRPNYERPMMSTGDKAKNKAQEAKGRVEEVAGKATNDRSRQGKGKKDQAAGNLKQAGEKVKDAVRK